MSKPYVIFAPSYDSKSGGVIALHKLCHLLNEVGQTAYLVQPFTEHALTIYNKRRMLRKIRKELKLRKHQPHHVNPAFNTPKLKTPPARELLEDAIAIYPDVTPGNPLGTRHVVRWFLHRPGFHTGEVHYRTNDLIYDYRTFLDGYTLPGAKQSSLQLEITHTPTEIYNLDGALPIDERRGTAYCIKKGNGRQIIHDTSDSILIDSLPHDEIAKVFKTVKTFISYDTYTSYLTFAALCGADSIVVPEDGVSAEQWHSNPHTRYGIAYGFENLELARETRPLLQAETEKRETEQLDLVQAFVQETQTHFSLSN